MASSGSGDWKEWSKHVLLELERLNEEQHEMGKTLIENTQLLADHIRRTEIAEENLKILRDQFDQKIVPIERHVNLVNTLAKILVALGAIPAVLYSAASLAQMMHWIK